MASIKVVVRSFAFGAGLFVVGVIIGGILTIASLLIVRPVTSPNACGFAQCHNGVTTIAAWRGFPFGITESPVEPFQDCGLDLILDG